jgi:UDP-N-acetylglucosamine transferase subunit ALG13
VFPAVLTRASARENPWLDRESVPSRTLLVASGGGHLKQLSQLVDRLPWSIDDRVWCTVNTPQSRSLLAGEDVVYVESADPRDARAALANARRIRPVLRGSGFTHAVSTGASLAVSTLPQAYAAGAKCHYVESAARVNGPSLSGRLLSPFRHVHRYTQYRCWAGQTWKYAGSVFDSYVAGEPVEPRLDRVVVTLGTQEDYSFRALVQRVQSLIPPEAEVLWQTGATDVSDLGIDGRRAIPSAEFEAALADADAIIAHAGVGSALSALAAGRQPILVPRRVERREHVDNHQEQVACELHQRGLAIHAEVDDVDLGLLYEASARTVEVAPAPPGLQLDP